MELMINNYVVFKQELDTELNNAAESFVKIGYLLRMARDTYILAESGYKNVAEFAKAEYNLKPDQVTRFIQINERFGEGGRLSDKYTSFGYTKLVEMLQIPDAVNEVLTPEYTREDLRAIRKEITEEKAITDLEVLMEEPEENEKLISILKQIVENAETLRKELSEWNGEQEKLRWLLAPSGDNIYTVRVRGIGKFMVSIKEKEDAITLINLRSEEKESISWEEVAAAAGKVKRMLQEEPKKEESKEEPKEEMKQPQKKVTTVKEKKNEKNEQRRENEDVYGVEKESDSTEKERGTKKTESIRKSDEEDREEGRTKENAEKRPEESPEESENVNERADTTGSGAPIEGNTGADEGREVSEQHKDPEEDGRGEKTGNSTVETAEIAPAQILPAPVNTEADRHLTRKEYMDDLTEYGLADYLNKEYLSERLTGGMLAYPEKLEQWLLEPVTKNGEQWEKDENKEE